MSLGRLPRGRLLRGGMASCRCVRGSTFCCIETWLECVIVSCFIFCFTRSNRHAKPNWFRRFLPWGLFRRGSTHVPLDRPDPENGKAVSKLDPYPLSLELVGLVFAKHTRIRPRDSVWARSPPRPRISMLTGCWVDWRCSMNAQYSALASP